MSWCGPPIDALIRGRRAMACPGDYGRCPDRVVNCVDEHLEGVMREVRELEKTSRVVRPSLHRNSIVGPQPSLSKWRHYEFRQVQGRESTFLGWLFRRWPARAIVLHSDALPNEPL